MKGNYLQTINNVLGSYKRKKINKKVVWSIKTT